MIPLIKKYTSKQTVPSWRLPLPYEKSSDSQNLYSKVDDSKADEE